MRATPLASIASCTDGRQRVHQPSKAVLRGISLQGRDEHSTCRPLHTIGTRRSFSHWPLRTRDRQWKFGHVNLRYGCVTRNNSWEIHRSKLFSLSLDAITTHLLICPCSFPEETLQQDDEEC